VTVSTHKLAWRLVASSLLSAHFLLGCDKPPNGGGIYVSEFTLRERVLAPLPPNVELPATVADGRPFVFELDISIGTGAVLSVRHLLDQNQDESEILKQSLLTLRFRVSDLTSKGTMTGRLTFYTMRCGNGSICLRNPRFPSIWQDTSPKVQAAKTHTL